MTTTGRRIRSLRSSVKLELKHSFLPSSICIITLILSTVQYNLSVFHVAHYDSNEKTEWVAMTEIDSD